MYVWVDALTNYITGAGFPDATEPRVALLAGRRARHRQGHRALPRRLLAGLPDVGRPRAAQARVRHGFVLNKGEKMSKSVGNVVDPFDLVHAYGVDQVRYFFLREVMFGQDGNYSPEAIANRINADLANDLGNLAQRSLSMIAKNCDGKVPEPGAFTDADKAILAAADAHLRQGARGDGPAGDHALPRCRVGAWSADANRYFAGEEPWAKKKTDPERMETILYVTAEVVRQVAILAAAGDAGRRRQSCSTCSASGTATRALRGAGRGGPPEARHRPARAGTASSRATSTPEAGSGAGEEPAPKPKKPKSRRRTSAEEGQGRERANVMLVDHHCHLDFPEFAADLDGVVARAQGGGRRHHGDHLDAHPPLRRSCSPSPSAYDNVYCSVGTHPAPRRTRSSTSRSTRSCGSRSTRRSSRSARPGSTTSTSSRRPEAQAEGFRRHIAAARATGLPLEIHTRDADDDTLAHPRGRARQGRLPGDPALLHRRAGAGAARRRSRALRVVLRRHHLQEVGGAARRSPREVPLDRLLVETDAPYLAPEPYRGKTQRAGLRRAHGRDAGQGEGRLAGRARGGHDRQLLPPVHARSPRPARRSAAAA